MESNNTRGEAKYKYFIEDIDTGLWFKDILQVNLFDENVFESLSQEDEWTNDPHKAFYAFNSKEAAEEFLADGIKSNLVSFLNHGVNRNLIVTEHEFVGNCNCKKGECCDKCAPTLICPETKKECVQHPSQCSTVCWELQCDQRKLKAALIHFSTLDKMPTLGLLDREGVIDHVVNIAKEKLVVNPPVPGNYQESPEFRIVQKPMDIVYYNMAKQMTQKEFSEWLFKSKEQHVYSKPLEKTEEEVEDIVSELYALKEWKRQFIEAMPGLLAIASEQVPKVASQEIVEILRSFNAIIERRGANTNWNTIEKKVKAILNLKTINNGK